MLKLNELIRLLKEISKGKSIIRGFSDIKIDQFIFSGDVVLDLGGGIGTYRDKLNKTSGVSIFVLDVRKEAKSDIIANLENKLPFQTNSIDSVFLNFVIEHIFNVEQLLNEIHRILKKGGKLYMTSPFLMPIHTLESGNFYVDDFNRFTESALRNFLSNYDSATIDGLDVGPFMAATSVIFYILRFSFLRLMFLIFSWILDKVYYVLRGNGGDRGGMRYIIGYCCVAEK
ncbi:MAG: methyltransferase domain-containing protein [Candidatus Hodarchaeales archaeon]|jgi:SAM-dependent methyltransferase